MSTSCCAPRSPASPSAAIDVDDLAALCKALGHPARVQLLRHLIDVGECYFGNLADVLPLAPSTISKHVSILKDAGLIHGSSDVQRVCYCVNPERLQQLKAMIVGL
ncbi:ArsR/SmtB family transcription factor [Massilia niastensis]|uniref:ArsR/SmtB family transcription factor n=1 Tax=Massilia niastensis TaxID=544911 RepID=UPI0012EC06D1|nr:metalloregulator ArsR/SmtB family transcription factor [Massilia niastensis]